jgi:addiction module RelE/StbE family toxin
MIVRYSPKFYRQLKKQDIRVKKRVRIQFEIFSENAYDSRLNNHSLQDKYEGCRSINITADYRAIYQEIDEGGNKVAYFVTIGTHDQLYGLKN